MWCGLINRTEGLAEYSAMENYRRQDVTWPKPSKYELGICANHAIVRQHTNKFQVVAYHMALIADNALQRVLPEMLVMALRTFSNRPSMSVSTLLPPLECGDQRYYDSTMSLNRPMTQ
jgi:hypothetical protein